MRSRTVRICVIGTQEAIDKTYKKDHFYKEFFHRFENPGQNPVGRLQVGSFKELRSWKSTRIEHYLELFAFFGLSRFQYREQITILFKIELI